MVFSESAKIVINKIQKLDPENASKIIGYLLLQDDCEQEMLQWALCSETQLLSLVNSVKAKFRFSPKLTISAPVPIPIHPSGPISDLPLQFTSFTPALSCPFSSPATFPAGASSYWDPQLVNTNQQPVHTIDFVPSAALYGDLHEDDYCLHNQAQFLGLEDQMVPSINAVRPDFSGNYYHTESQLGPFSPRMSRRSPSLSEFPFKVCHYFNKGYCKHGKNCRYSHDQALPDSFSPIVSPGLNDLVNKDHIFSSDSLEELELELTELLRSRKGMPVSIASLPMLYYEKYGKTLQANGYLTESQRHGKAGYSLTKLLVRLKNSIRVIDRPHGQHSVVLAEDAPKYMENRSEKSDPGEIVVGSRQIYLTFPAESTFTEDDVSNYFKTFGPVQDVRIPCQQKRMFGFVTFLYPETVKSVLTKGNPHFVCGSRVLVKPYREKSRLVDRKYTEKIVPPMYFSSYLSDMDGELNSVPRVCRNSRLHRKQLIEEQEQMLELQRLRLSELHFAPKQLSQQSCVSFSMEESKVGDHSKFSFLFDILNNGSTSDDQAKHASSNYSEPDSQELNLPESPFASAIASSISTVI